MVDRGTSFTGRIKAVRGIKDIEKGGEGLSFGAVQLTNAGRQLLTQAIAGGSLHFTKPPKYPADRLTEGQSRCTYALNPRSTESSASVAEPNIPVQRTTPPLPQHPADE